MNLSPSDLVRLFVASATPIWMKRLWAGRLTRISCNGFRPTWTPAAKMASFIPLLSPGRFSNSRSKSRSAKKSIARSRKPIRVPAPPSVQRPAHAAPKDFGFVICCPLRELKPTQKNMNKSRLSLLTVMILAATAARLIPHPPNFSPIAAMALFGGAAFADKRAAFLMPLAGLFLSDLVLGFYTITPVVYGSFAVIVCLGLWVRRRRSAGRIAGAAVMGGLLFFVITNFGVWAMGQL